MKKFFLLSIILLVSLSMTPQQTTIDKTVTQAFAQTNKTLEKVAVDVKELKNSSTVKGELGEINSGVSTVYNDGKDVVKTVYQDIKSMTPEIKNALEQLAKALKTTSEELWKILVKQQRVYSYAILLSLLFSIGVMYSFVKALNKYHNQTLPASEFQIIYLILTGILTIFGIFFQATHIVQMFTGFANPEYGALMEIINFANTLK